MAFREAVLALLSVGPRHGYQLKLDFEAATGAAWPLNIGQVYTTLQRVERDGLAEVVDTDSDGRIIYRLTPAGEKTIAAWLSRPVDRPVTDREELSMKLLLTLAVGVADPQSVIDTQRSATMASYQDYTRLRQEVDNNDLAWQLLLERLMIAADAELRWLDRVEDRLAPNAPAVPAPSPPEVLATAPATFGGTP